MKFASFPKFALLLAPAVVFVVALAGCGSSKNLALTQGNWSVAATSTAIAAPSHQMQDGKSLSPNVSNASFYVGGNLTQTGTNVAGTMYFVGTCIAASSTAVNFTGTVKGTTVTLTSVGLPSTVITVTATGAISATSSLTGTYTVTGGCDGGDSGTVTANAVPSISGTWNGTLLVGTNGTAAPIISFALTQASTPSNDGTFALTGNIAYTNSGCSVSGTISSGTIAGNSVVISANTVEKDQSAGSFSFDNVLLDSPTAPANMTGTYDVSALGLCPGLQSLTLTKQ